MYSFRHFSRVSETVIFPMKLTSERALMHLLQIHENPDVLANYLRSVPPMDAEYLKTYVQRVLSKLPKGTEDDVGDF